MSTILRNGRNQPHASGMLFGPKQFPKNYHLIAYKLPGSDTWFAGVCTGPPVRNLLGRSKHTFTTAINGVRMTRKDGEVAAISEEEFNRLVQKEKEWWNDYYSYLYQHPDEPIAADQYAHEKVQLEYR